MFTSGVWWNPETHALNDAQWEYSTDDPDAIILISEMIVMNVCMSSENGCMTSLNHCAKFVLCYPTEEEVYVIPR